MREVNISPHNIVIRLLPSIIRFEQLLPADAVNTRDIYCDRRWKALQFLKTNGIIIDFTLIEGLHRWESEIEIKLDAEIFKNILTIVDEEMKKRTYKKKTQLETSLDVFWEMLHPKIVKIAKSRFETKHYADSVEAALKEVNIVVKSIIKQKTGQEYDGADLMNRAFSPQSPIIALDDLSTERGKSIQKGYMQIFSGAMTGIRNPKAHENIKIDEKKAIHFLFLSTF